MFIWKKKFIKNQEFNFKLNDWLFKLNLDFFVVVNELLKLGDGELISVSPWNDNQINTWLKNNLEM